jgi:hypothetical protein
MTRRITPLAILAAGLLIAAGCAQPAPDNPAGIEPGRQIYQVSATVLEAPGTGPQLCQSVADSYPPQCSGPEVVGWDWADVTAESASGTTWGSYRLTGTWDGQRFTLTGTPEPDVGPDVGPAPDTELVDLTTPCQTPAGGWRVLDPDTATMDALNEAVSRAAHEPGYAGSWVDQSTLAGGGNDPSRTVLNLRFTGDLAAAEQAIRQFWGGPLCVTGAERTDAELLDIQQRLHVELPDLVLGSGVDPVANAVTAQVVVVDPDLQRELDQRYGAGAVILQGWLRPVS